MFEYKIDNITIYNTSAFDVINGKCNNIEKKIASWIVDNKEKEIVEEIFEKNYENFDITEKNYIIDKTLDVLKNSKFSRKLYIEKQLYDYFAKEHFINIPGFIRFRLKEYKTEIENALDDVIDKYICEKEYHEFINLIREYVEYQKSYAPILNMLTTNEKTRYFDKHWIEITEMLNEEYSFETDLSNDDKLLTTLVLCAPQKIIWHNSSALKNQELKATVTEIFDGRIIFCNTCKMCNKFIKK